MTNEPLSIHGGIQCPKCGVFYDDLECPCKQITLMPKCVVCQFEHHPEWYCLFDEHEIVLCVSCEEWLEALGREVWIDPDSIRFYDHALSSEEIYQIWKDDQEEQSNE